MSFGLFVRLRIWCKAGKNRGLMLLLLVSMFFGGTLLFAADFVNSRLALEGGLTRNSYGAGSKTEELEVTAGEGEREDRSTGVGTGIFRRRA